MTVSVRRVAVAGSVCLLALASGTGHALAWGALAYSPATQAFGYTYDYATQAEAETTALTNCTARGADDCKVAIAISRTCGAVAWGKTSWGDPLFRQATGANKAEARAAALGQCSAADGVRDCKILVWTCDTQ